MKDSLQFLSDIVFLAQHMYPFLNCMESGAPQTNQTNCFHKKV